MSAGGAGGARRDEDGAPDVQNASVAGHRGATPQRTIVTVLASASSGRLAVLRAAGIEPVVLISEADEDAVRVRMAGAEPTAVIEAIAAAKADAVAATHRSELADAVVISGDSMLLLDGELQGKPHTRAETLRRWEHQMGRTGELITGHTVLRVRDGKVTGRASGSSRTWVTMGRPTRAELEAYLDSGEPLEVAGAFTIDGLGGWFVDKIDGDPSGVVGLSLPLVRRLLAEIDVAVTDLWNRRRE